MSERSAIEAGVVAQVRSIHAEVDAEVFSLMERLGPVLRCGLGCTDCCVDEVTLFEVEAERILADLGRRGIEGPPAPPGRCAFLGDDGACRIYALRPYVCRTQGLPLRWIDDDEGETVERRDICEIEERDVDLLALDAESCWTLGPFEGRLATLQATVDGGALRRISLRDLAERIVSESPSPRCTPDPA